MNGKGLGRAYTHYPILTPQTIPPISGAPAKGRALGMLSARRQGLLLDSELEDGLVGSAAAP